jgi:hypothetical protein
MSLRTRVVVTGVAAALGFLVSAVACQAEVAGSLQNVQIVSHQFSTRVSGENRKLTLKDISLGRYLVLKVAADNPADKVTVYKNDWLLVYRHQNGSEDRSPCDGIARCQSAAPGEFGNFLLDKVAGYSFTERRIELGLIFYIEPDVESIQLFRIGNAEPVVYTIGPNRPLSVYVSMNSQVTPLLPQLKKTLEEGGYQLTFVSNQLPQDKTGAKILYSDKAEAAAREISQRIMTNLQMTPTLEVLGDNVNTAVDILLWIGK